MRRCTTSTRPRHAGGADQINRVSAVGIALGQILPWRNGLRVISCGPSRRAYKSKAYRGWPQLKRQNQGSRAWAPSVTLGRGLFNIIISIFAAVLTLLQRQPPAPYRLVAPLFVVPARPGG